MFKKEEKDRIIEFLRNTIKDIRKKVDYMEGYHYYVEGCDYYDSEMCGEIIDACDKAIAETTF